MFVPPTKMVSFDNCNLKRRKKMVIDRLQPLAWVIHTIQTLASALWRIRCWQNYQTLASDSHNEFDRPIEESRHTWRSRITSAAMWPSAIVSHDTLAWSALARCEQQSRKSNETWFFLSYFAVGTMLDRWSTAQIELAMLIEIETEFDLLSSSSVRQHRTEIAKGEKISRMQNLVE